MSPPCRIEGQLKLGANQNNETFIWYLPENRWLSMEEFKKCDIGNDVKIVLKIENEKVKKHASNYPDLSLTTFNNIHDFSLAPTPLKLNDMGVLHYEEQSQPEPLSTPPSPPDPTSLSDLFVGGAATIAMVMSIMQQVRQKKKEAEASICCNNNKVEISKFDMKLQKLETEIKAKSEKDNKGMFAEILETRKEIRDMKEDFEHGKEDLQKLIEIIELKSKNK
jgi:hypothetical protein